MPVAAARRGNCELKSRPIVADANSAEAVAKQFFVRGLSRHIHVAGLDRQASCGVLTLTAGFGVTLRKPQMQFYRRMGKNQGTAEIAQKVANGVQATRKQHSVPLTHEQHAEDHGPRAVDACGMSRETRTKLY